MSQNLTQYRIVNVIVDSRDMSIDVFIPALVARLRKLLLPMLLSLCHLSKQSLLGARNNQSNEASGIGFTLAVIETDHTF